MPAHTYWMAYDLSSDHERVRVEKCLSRYGVRLQKSLFVCVLDAGRCSRLRAELEGFGCTSGFIAFAAMDTSQKFGTMGRSAATLGEDWFFGFPDALYEQANPSLISREA